VQHVDGARFYGNEVELGEGVRQSGVPREEVWVTSKIWDSDQANCLAAVKDSVKKIGLGYIDLMLLHSPNPGKATRTKAYADLVEAKKQGLVKSIGVS
jgi:diketogulonate reductase-like aldo/keto reductase